MPPEENTEWVENQNIFGPIKPKTKPIICRLIIKCDVREVNTQRICAGHRKRLLGFLLQLVETLLICKEKQSATVVVMCASTIVCIFCAVREYALLVCWVVLIITKALTLNDSRICTRYPRTLTAEPAANNE